jgi:SPP1 family predicted phage head-tail adaptor
MSYLPAAGLLDRRITIQSATITQNAIGEAISTWSNFATVWASVEPISGREFWAMQQVHAEVTVRIRIRYLAGVLPKMRITGSGSKVFNIEAIINPAERNGHLELLCSEGVVNE